MASPEKINIPQGPPMVMVDRLVRTDGTVTETELTIRSDNIFVEDGFLQEPGLIENMAQTAAAGTGAGPGSEAPRTGFIGGIRELFIRELPAVGTVIRTNVTLEHTVFDASVIRAEIRCGDRVIAGCQMKIFLV